mmetsp:Transcript_83303/g.131794  ORF Transcript_83303/g.131794 Transcript_83303/m.131794 type:complete len:214 (+) Transcript_83303:173-814(+)
MSFFKAHVHLLVHFLVWIRKPDVVPSEENGSIHVPISHHVSNFGPGSHYFPFWWFHRFHALIVLTIPERVHFNNVLLHVPLWQLVLLPQPCFHVLCRGLPNRIVGNLRNIHNFEAQVWQKDKFRLICIPLPHILRVAALDVKMDRKGITSPFTRRRTKCRLPVRVNKRIGMHFVCCCGLKPRETHRGAGRQRIKRLWQQPCTSPKAGLMSRVG